jgi:hypothetical protein
MSEERMLRVTPPKNWHGNIKVLFYEGGDWVKGIWVESKDLEPAPQEDWVPCCYDENNDGCLGRIRTRYSWITTEGRGENVTYHPQCYSCPYHKRD